MTASKSFRRRKSRRGSCPVRLARGRLRDGQVKSEWDDREVLAQLVAHVLPRNRAQTDVPPDVQKQQSQLHRLFSAFEQAGQPRCGEPEQTLDERVLEIASGYAHSVIRVDRKPKLLSPAQTLREILIGDLSQHPLVAKEGVTLLQRRRREADFRGVGQVDRCSHHALVEKRKA